MSRQTYYTGEWENKSVQMWEKTDQNNSKYGHILRSVDFRENK